MSTFIKLSLLAWVAFFGCIDEQSQNASKDDEVQKKEVVDEDVRTLNENHESKDSNTNPEYSIKEVLFDAVQKGDLEKVKSIFDGGFIQDINLRNPNDMQDEKTILMEAAAWGRIAVIEYLLGLNADVELKDLSGKTAFDWAKSINNILIMDLLSGRELSQEMMLEKLYEFCAVGGHADEIIFILSRGVNPDYARESDNITPLFEAARSGKLDSITALLDHGASVNFHRKGYTGLIGAITSKNPEIVEAVLNYGADPTIPFERGGRKASPREYAQNILRSQPDILEVILEQLDAALAKKS